MNVDAVRERLAAELRDDCESCGDIAHVVESLLPVVLEIAAEELLEAARDVDDGEFSDRWSDTARRAVLARADALTKPPDGLVR